MAIVLKYGAPGPTLTAGYAAGRGQRQNQLQDQGLRLWQQAKYQDFQAQQSALNRAQQAGLQQAAQQFQANQAQIGRRQQALLQGNAQAFQGTQQRARIEAEAQRQKELLSARSAESKLEQEQRLKLQEQHQQFLAEQNTLTGLRRGELSLPPAAQMELQKLEAGRVEASNPKWSPAEQEQFMQLYEDRKRQLLGMAQPSDQVPYDERLKKNLGANYEQYKNLPWQFNNQGEMSLPSGFKMPGDAQAEAAKNFTEGVIKRYEKNLGKKDENNPEGMSHEDAQRAAVDEQVQVEKFRQQISQGILPPDNPRLSSAYQTMQRNLAAGNRSWTSDAGSIAGPVGTQPASLPQVKTPEEAAKLPPGTMFIGPDGKKRQVPFQEVSAGAGNG